MQMTSHREPVALFISYASEDEPLLGELETHLSLLKRQGLISIWYRRKIVPGMDRAESIDKHLKQADVILLLVSPDFLASDFCYGVEMKLALERHEASEARVVPLLLRPVHWNEAPFAHLQPIDAKPVTMWHNRDAAFAEVVAGIRHVIEELQLLATSSLYASSPAIWSIPYARNLFFTGRDDVLLYLHEQLQTAQTVAHSQSPLAISGLSGIGKTDIALEYAYTYRDEYQAVFWVDADTDRADCADR